MRLSVVVAALAYYGALRRSGQNFKDAWDRTFQQCRTLRGRTGCEDVVSGLKRELDALSLFRVWLKPRREKWVLDLHTISAFKIAGLSAQLQLLAYNPNDKARLSLDGILGFVNVNTQHLEHERPNVDRFMVIQVPDDAHPEDAVIVTGQPVRSGLLKSMELRVLQVDGYRDPITRKAFLLINVGNLESKYTVNGVIFPRCYSR